MAEHYEVLGIVQLEQCLKVRQSTLYRLADEGGTPGHKVGRHWRFRRESVDRWLDLAGEQPLKDGETR